MPRRPRQEKLRNSFQLTGRRVHNALRAHTATRSTRLARSSLPWLAASDITHLYLVEASKTRIKRHIKIRSEATPYNPIYHDYLDERILKRMEIEEKTKRPDWWRTWWDLLKPRDNELEVTGSSIMAL